MKVGDTIWRFDYNRRVYGKDRSSPIWREYWSPRVISGETSRSWIVGAHKWDQYKIPKNGTHNKQMWAFSAADIDAGEWIWEHRTKLCEALRRCDDADALKSVAALLNWHPAAPGDAR